MVKISVEGSRYDMSVRFYIEGVDLKKVLPNSKNFVIAYNSSFGFKSKDGDLIHEIMVYTNKSKGEVFDIISILPFWEIYDCNIINYTTYASTLSGIDKDTPFVYKIFVKVELEKAI